MRKPTHSVVLVSERNVYQTTLRTMVDSTTMLQVVGVASGCLSALNLVQELKPNFVLIAATLPEAEVVTFLDSVRELDLSTRVVVLRNIPWARPQLITAGAAAVIDQDSSVTDLLAAFFTHTD